MFLDTWRPLRRQSLRLATAFFSFFTHNRNLVVHGIYYYHFLWYVNRFFFSIHLKSCHLKQNDLGTHLQINSSKFWFELLENRFLLIKFTDFLRFSTLYQKNRYQNIFLTFASQNNKLDTISPYFEYSWHDNITTKNYNFHYKRHEQTLNSPRALKKILRK